MKLEIISGSTRKDSLSKRVALYLQKWFAENTAHETGIINLQEWDLPPVQSVFSSVDKTPEEFRPLTKRIFEADAFILVTPEYNGSYSPAMKNLLDHFPKQHHIPFGIVTASPGPMGGIRAAMQVQLLVNALFGIASPYMLIVPAIDKKFNETGELTDMSFHQNIQNFTAEFLWLSENLVDDKITVSNQEPRMKAVV